MKKVSFFFFFSSIDSIRLFKQSRFIYRESANWSVSCTVQSNSDVASYEYEIRYLGDNPSLIEKVKTKFMSENIHSKREVPFNNIIRGKGEGMSPFLDENEFIVQIDWEGNSEKIIVTK